MKQIFIIALVAICTVSCKTKQQNTIIGQKEIPFEYGYTKENPIKVGGIHTQEGPANEREYLRSLVDLQGNNLSFYRKGSCCNFKTPNGLINGSGMLDIYAVYVKGKTDTVNLYLNMYDEDKLLAPRGFKFKM